MSKRKWVADRVQQAFDSVDMKSVQYLLHPMARSALEDLHAVKMLDELYGADDSWFKGAVADDIATLACKLEARAVRVLEAMRMAEERGEAVGGVAVDNAPSDSGE